MLMICIQKIQLETSHPRWFVTGTVHRAHEGRVLQLLEWVGICGLEGLTLVCTYSYKVVISKYSYYEANT